MISDNDNYITIGYAKKNVTSVILFGSSIQDESVFNDIDIAVKGIKPSLFFKFHGELFKNLSKPVDLVDMSHKNLFTQLIKENGIKIYG